VHRAEQGTQVREQQAIRDEVIADMVDRGQIPDPS
jgi:hypothetical protein